MRRLFVGVALAALALAATGCDRPRDVKHTLLVTDVSLSGLNPAARLDEEGMKMALRDLDALKPGDVLTVVVFGSTLTNACEPITVDFAEQTNSEEQDTLRTSMRTAFPAAYRTYITCVRDKAAGGSPGRGSPIFGAVVESLVRAGSPVPVTHIQVVTDGCSYMEKVPVCGAGMTNPGFAKKTVSRMATELKPSLAGIPLVVVGLGRGTGMSSHQVSVLREVFQQYASATGTTVQFY